MMNVIEICSEIIEEEFEGDSVIDSDINLLKPVEIKNFLDQHVAGQMKQRKY